MRTKMKVEDHLTNAEELCSAIEKIKSVFFRCQEHNGSSNPTVKKLWKFVRDYGVFMKIKSELDEEWHNLIDDETFKKYGHIYYGQRRDKELNNG
tara:strand:+ start:428 stop:712 length:285 start_codon:yes stop_codon:yes gene_type:complete